MYDVSIVTDALRDIVIDAIAASPLFAPAGPPFSVAVSGQHPVAPTDGADCDLNLYLFHLSEDRHQKNAFWRHESTTGQPPGPARQPIAFEPLALDLHFLLSAQSQTSYVQEQQVMSIAVRALHQHASITLATPTPTGHATSKVTLMLEAPSADELSRLWQALNAPLRMTAQYRVSVVLLTPETGLTAHPEPTTWTLTAAPSTGGEPAMPLLYGTSRRVRHRAASGAQRTFDQTPATTAPAPSGVAGQEVLLRGRGLDDGDRVFLVDIDADGTEDEDDVTAPWKVALTTPYTTVPAEGVPFVLRPPDVPGACPPPGRYLLRVGRPTTPGWRSNAVPISIAPWIEQTGGPVIAPGGGGIFSRQVRNVPDDGAQLRLGTVPLERVTSGTPAAGQWRVAGNTLTFRPPAGLAAGHYELRLRAADVEADPGVWVGLP